LTGPAERALADFAHEPNGGLIVLPGPILGAQQASTIGLALRYRLPAVFPAPEEVRLGGLMAYGSDMLDRVRKTAGYIDRILKGEKPGDLPIQQPTKFRLIINLKTAKARSRWTAVVQILKVCLAVLPRHPIHPGAAS
jgi:putative tryptophan/tyrosine transport system substrate-binding protein